MGKRKLYKILKQYIEKNSIYKLQPIQNYYYSEDHIDCRLYDMDNYDGISVKYIKRENIFEVVIIDSTSYRPKPIIIRDTFIINERES